MTTRNLLMALTVCLLLTATAERHMAHRAGAAEPVLLLPPVVAAAGFDLAATPIAPAQAHLEAARRELNAQRRVDLERHLDTEFRRSLHEVSVATP